MFSGVTEAREWLINEQKFIIRVRLEHLEKEDKEFVCYHNCFQTDFETYALFTLYQFQDLEYNIKQLSHNVSLFCNVEVFGD